MPSSDSLANSTSSTSQALACSSAVDRRQFIRYSVAMVAGGQLALWCLRMLAVPQCCRVTA